MASRNIAQTLVDQHARRARRKVVFAIVCTVGVLLGGVYLAARRFPATWRQSIETCDPEEIVPRLHRLVDMPPDGLRRVAASLGSTREEIARGAAEVLGEHLTLWELLPPHIARRNVSILAAEMAQGVAEYSPRTKHEAAKLAKRILRWPADPRSSNRVQLVSYCDIVLQTAEPKREPAQLASLETVENRKLPAEDRRSSRLQTPMQRISREVPGGGLSIDLHTHALEEAFDETPPDVQTAPNTHHANQTDRGSLAIDARQPHRLETSPETDMTDAREPPNDDPRSHQGRHEQATSEPNRPARLPLDADLLTKLWNQPQSLTSFELLRLAQTGDDATSQHAWNEIRARDIPPKFLELGLHVTDPDPAVRRRWVGRLTSLPGIDARPWLLALSDDEDAEVRMTAIVLMATTGDPRLLRRIEQIARDDREPQIQDQARRILAGDRPDSQ